MSYRLLSCDGVVCLYIVIIIIHTYNNDYVCDIVCIEGTVGLAGNILYSTGPVGVCNSGYMRYNGKMYNKYR